VLKLHLDTDLGGDIDDLCALAMVLNWPERLSILRLGRFSGLVLLHRQGGSGKGHESACNTKGTLLPGRGLSRVGSVSALNGLRRLFSHQGTGADGGGCPARSASGRRCRPRTLGCAAGRQGQGAESMGGSC
jgi:hypothetical protein